MKLEIEIEKITVLVGDGYADLIRIYTTLPSKLWGVRQTILDTQAGEGSGVQWVRDNLGIEPEVLTR